MLKRVWCSSLLALSLAALAGIPLIVPQASAATPPVIDACFEAGNASNAVVRFYRAVDLRQFGLAYQCLAPSEQARLPFATFVAGYAHTVASRLLVARDEDPVGNGHVVDIDLHAVDTVNGGLILSVYRGTWTVDSANRLLRAHIQRVRRQTVRAIPPLNIPDIFAYDGQSSLEHERWDVTGNGIADDLYITAGTGCASCHVQQIWVFSGGRLIFQESATNATIYRLRGIAGFSIRKTAPSATGPECCPSMLRYETWHWTRTGFVLYSTRDVRVH